MKEQRGGLSVDVDYMSLSTLRKYIFSGNHITLGISNRIYLEFQDNSLTFLINGIKQGNSLYDTRITYELQNKCNFTYKYIRTVSLLSLDQTIDPIINFSSGALLHSLIYFELPNTKNLTKPVVCKLRLVGNADSLHIASDKLHNEHKKLISTNKQKAYQLNCAKIEYNTNKDMVSLDLPSDGTFTSIIDMTGIEGLDWYQDRLGKYATVIVCNLRKLREPTLHRLLNNLIADRKYISLVDYKVYNIGRLLNEVTRNSIYLLINLEQMRARMMKRVLYALATKQISGISVITEEVTTLSDYAKINKIYNITIKNIDGRLHFTISQQAKSKAVESAFNGKVTWLKTVMTSIEQDSIKQLKENSSVVIEKLYQELRRSSGTEPVKDKIL